MLWIFACVSVVVWSHNGASQHQTQSARGGDGPQGTLKVGGIGWTQYWCEGWNRFDFIIVIVGLISINSSGSGGGGQVGALRALRTLRSRAPRRGRGGSGLLDLVGVSVLAPLEPAPSSSSYTTMIL